MIEAFRISPSTRDLRPLVLNGDRLMLMPSEFWRSTTPEERGLFGTRTGMYGFTSVELVHRLHRIIAGRSAIEIGAGCGHLASALGIRATDNRQMEHPGVAALYDLLRQAVTKYGDHVEGLDAHEAVAKYRPQVVVAQWVTQRYDPNRHEEGGNQFGPDLRQIMDAVETFIFIGNRQVHRHSPVLKRDAVFYEQAPPDVFSRAMNGSPDFLAVVNK